MHIHADDKKKKKKAHLHHKAIQSCIKWSKESPLSIHVKNYSLDFYTRNDSLKDDLSGLNESFLVINISYCIISTSFFSVNISNG